MKRIEDLDDYSDESEDESEITNFLKQCMGKTEKIPSDFTIDELLKQRKNEMVNIPNEERNAEESEEENQEEKQMLKEFEKLKQSDVQDVDATIFGENENSVKQDMILEKIWNERYNILSKLEPIDNDKLMVFELFPNLIEANEDFFWKCLYTLIINKKELKGNNIFSFIKAQSDFNISYETWKEFLLYSLMHYNDISYDLISIFNYNLFSYNSPEERTESFLFLVSLYCSLLFSCTFINHQKFPMVSKKLKELFQDDNYTLSSENIQLLCDSIFHLYKELPPQSITGFCLYFPIYSFGLIIITKLSMMIFSHFLNGRIDHLVQIGDNLSSIKGMCESHSKEELLKVSAFLALTERVIVASIQTKDADFHTIEHISRSLRFILQNSAINEMTLLKEQIHITRTQSELLSQSEVNPNAAAALFHPEEGCINRS